MPFLIPGWMRWYKKPSYVDLKSFASLLNKRAEQQEFQASSRASLSSIRSETAIPKDLTLERILNNKTCSPMSLYDFYMYLKHIEFSQENLEFYVWFKDYEERHTRGLPSIGSHTSKSEVASPEISSSAKNDESILKKHGYKISEYELCTPSNFDKDFMTYIESLILQRAACTPKPCCTVSAASAGAYISPTPTSLPILLGPYSDELSQVVSLFLLPSAPKELNIPPSLRKDVITALQSSDSPERFSKIVDHVYTLLKHCSHRNFVRLGVKNGTFETLCMVTFIGITFTCAGFIAMLLLAFASPSPRHSSRWRGLASIPFWFVGLSFLLAGTRGSCFLLLLVSRRQELPWERIGDDSSVISKSSHTTSMQKFVRKMMIFERKVRVKDVGLRRLQRRIVVQSVVGALVGTALLEVFWLCLPIWHRSL